MAIKIRTIEELSEKLDADAQWRKKEIIDMKSFCRANDFPPCMLRSAFVLVCAHFEGAIKYASNAYIAYISAQKILGKDLRVEISAISVRKKKHSLFQSSGTKKVRISVVSDVLSEYDRICQSEFYIKLNEDDMIPEIDEEDPALPMGGNPTPEVLFDISTILDLDYANLFELRSAFIDKELLKPRHCVAHGEKRTISEQEFEAASNYVIEIIDKFKTGIINSAQENKHLRIRTL